MRPKQWWNDRTPKQKKAIKVVGIAAAACASAYLFKRYCRIPLPEDFWLENMRGTHKMDGVYLPIKVVKLSRFSGCDQQRILANLPSGQSDVYMKYPGMTKVVSIQL